MVTLARRVGRLARSARPAGGVPRARRVRRVLPARRPGAAADAGVVRGRGRRARPRALPALRSGRPGAGRGGSRPVPLINHVRVPALGAGLTLLMFWPGIVRQGEATHLAATGLDQAPYLGRWLALSALLFAASAVIYGCADRAAPGPGMIAEFGARGAPAHPVTEPGDHREGISWPSRGPPGWCSPPRSSDDGCWPTVCTCTCPSRRCLAQWLPHVGPGTPFAVVVAVVVVARGPRLGRTAAVAGAARADRGRRGRLDAVAGAGRRVAARRRRPPHLGRRVPARRAAGARAPRAAARVRRAHPHDGRRPGADVVLDHPRRGPSARARSWSSCCSTGSAWAGAARPGCW